MVAGAFGVFGYTGDGISQSLDRAVHRGTRKRISAAKQAELEYLIRYGSNYTANPDIVEAFCRRQLT